MGELRIRFLPREEEKPAPLEYVEGLDALLVQNAQEEQAMILAQTYPCWHQEGNNTFVFDLGYTMAELHTRVWRARRVVEAQDHEKNYVLGDFLFYAPIQAVTAGDVQDFSSRMPRPQKTLLAGASKRPYALGVVSEQDLDVALLLAKATGSDHVQTVVGGQEVSYIATTPHETNPHYADYLFRKYLGAELDFQGITETIEGLEQELFRK